MDIKFNMADIERAATAEFLEEKRREAIDKCKEKLRAKRWWYNLFPYRIVFVKR